MGKMATASGKDRRKEKKPTKKGKKVLKDRKEEYLKKQLKKDTKKQTSRTAQADGDTITIAWKGKKKEVDKKTLQADKKGKQLLKKIANKRVLNADEKHRLKMLGEVGDLMKLWEVLREKNKPKDEKLKAIDQILSFTKDTFKDDVRKPDMSRIFQSVLKWGTPAVRREIYVRVQGMIGELCTSSHANQFVKHLVEYATPATRDEILQEISKTGSQILSHKNALLVLEHLHNKLNAEKQHLLIMSFFDGLELKSHAGFPKLLDVLAQMSPNTLEYKRVIERLFKLLSPSVTKGTFDNVVVHRLLEALLKYGTEFEINDIIEDIAKGVVNICNTKPGSACAILIAEHAPQKLRKSIVKSFSHSVVDMCCAKFASFFMCRLFDVFDDVPTLVNVVGKELTAGVRDLLVDPHGSLLLLHLLTPDPEHKRKYFTFNRYDELWHDSPDVDPFHIPALTTLYAAKPKRICATHPREKHAAVLSAIMSPMVAALLENPQEMVDNLISRRVITELLHYTSTSEKVKLNASARQTFETLLEVRAETQRDKAEKRTTGQQTPATETPAAGAKPAGKAAKKRKAAEEQHDDTPKEESAQKPPQGASQSSPVAASSVPKKRKIVKRKA
ncbi:Pumilio-like protein 24 [Diplonema papillatum]|nr:Pumilio-like protein 24 [Diplonema papillatum]